MPCDRDPSPLAVAVVTKKRTGPPAVDPRQLALVLDEPTLLPYQRHSETSRAAAEHLARAAVTMRARVFALLKRSGPMTDEQMQDALGMNPSTQRPRRVELWQRGLVEDSGERDRTKSGRAAVVWRVRAEPSS